MQNPFPDKAVTAVLLWLCSGQWLSAWTPLPVKEDRLVFLPGSQPGSVEIDGSSWCHTCHGRYDREAEQSFNWQGGLMANAARDPLWLACLTTTLQDSIWVLGNPNVGDLCVRCHSPAGWLGGRSDPPNLTLLSGSDFEGVNCDTCHKLMDPLPMLRQLRELAEESDPTAIGEASATLFRDFKELLPIRLFDGTPYLNPATGLATFFGTGTLPDFIEASVGEFFMDPGNFRRGPRYDNLRGVHSWHYSRFHKTRYHCGTCHDVSNPVLGRLLSGDLALPEKQAGASYVHVERTFSEFMVSAYAQPGGEEANAGMGLPADTRVTKCQDCHMRKVVGRAANRRWAPVRDDLALHDQTGGNTWVAGILATVDRTNPTFDPYNYAILSGTKYPGAKIEIEGLQGWGQAMAAGQMRASEQLQKAATLVPTDETAEQLRLGILNNTGHKLISGFPEGRRMWLNVKFYNAEGQLAGEVNPYRPLEITRDAEGNAKFTSGGSLTPTHPELVYEVAMSSALTGEDYTLHFALATDLYKDNRIPPKGCRVEAMAERLVTPRWHGEAVPGYFSAEEYAGGYDEISLEKPHGTVRWEASLYYQTTSDKYVAFLRDEIEGTGAPVLGQEYLVQTDPYFSTLKDWGKAIYDLWLHNGGCPPVLVANAAGGIER